MALPGTSTPSIRPSGSLASPSMSLGADNTLEHPCRRRPSKLRRSVRAPPATGILALQ
jgi:hypothetical protein